jgi:signal transduction histidine kinase
MNGVIASTDLLLNDENSSSLNVEQRELLHIIKNSGQAMLSLINDILDLSKIEAGKFQIDINDFDIRECIETSFDVIGHRAVNKNLQIGYYITENVPHLIQSDSTRVKQILFNLLSNALKFTPKVTKLHCKTINSFSLLYLFVYIVHVIFCRVVLH